MKPTRRSAMVASNCRRHAAAWRLRTQRCAIGRLRAMGRGLTQPWRHR